MLDITGRNKSNNRIIAASAPPPGLDTVLASTVFDLDATIAASYPGTGATWLNLTAAPADGAAAETYNFTCGDGTDAARFPAFNGAAGDKTAYWSFDGDDCFRIAGAANTPFTNCLHHPAADNQWWAAFTFTTPATINAHTALFGTHHSNSTVGLNFFFLDPAVGGFFRLQQRGSSQTGFWTLHSTLNAASTDFLAIVSYTGATNTARLWLNGATAVTTAVDFKAGTDNATQPLLLCARGNISNPQFTALPDMRLYSAAMGNEYLDDAKAAPLIAALQARHGRSYGITP